MTMLPAFEHLIRRLGLPALALGLAASTAQATPALDPICGPPNSLTPVLALRAQKLAEAQMRRGSVRSQQAGDLLLSIERPLAADSPRLVLQGAAGRIHHLETAADVSAARWDPVLSAVLDEQPLVWSDEWLGTAPSGFFRLRGDSPEGAEDLASNFRVLDAEGVARDLYYHWHLTGITLISAGTNLDYLAPLAPLLNELAQTYTNQVQTWILLSDPAPIRSNVLAQAQSLGLGFPVLLDTHGLAANSVGLTRAGEVALVRTPEFAVAYRGDAAGSAATTAAQSFLGKALAGLVDGAPVTFLRTPTHGPKLAHTTEVTPSYSRDIAPLLHTYCAKCHRADGVAPFALTNYSVVKAQARDIKHAVLSGKMPPWHADPESGRFANDISLPPSQKASLVRWLDAGASRGDGNDPLEDLPPPPAFDRWPEELGEPDALVTIPIQPIKATGTENYRYIFAQTPNTNAVWLRAAVIRPSNYKAVHHYLVWLGRIGNQSLPGTSTYQPHFAEFVPGYEPFQFPPDAGVRLSRSNWVTFNLHYTPYGVETNDQPVLALWYHKTKPAQIWNTDSPGNGDFVIPPGARDHRVQAEMTLTSPIRLHRMNPHMHVRGKRVKYEVVYPGGRREVLLSVPDYDFGWQIGYALAEPKALPAGSKIVVSGAFDNSPQNLANPDPTARVRWGDQSWAEMFVGFMDYTQ